MVYYVIGIMSGSSLDGMDIAFVQLEESRGKWSHEILVADCLEYEQEWIDKLTGATSLMASDYQRLHAEYGHYMGTKVNAFMKEHLLHHKVYFISSHGHTTFHDPARGMTHQLGEGAAIAAEVALPVITDLRAMDVALGGQGAPVVPIGEKYLFENYPICLNIGGISNISFKREGDYIAFDVCPANRVLNLLAQQRGLSFDNEGHLASVGTVSQQLLHDLNSLDYYKQPAPKSLSNRFGLDVIYPKIERYDLAVEDKLATYVQHIAAQVRRAVDSFKLIDPVKMLATGGGALNNYLMEQIQAALNEKVKVIVPDDSTVKFKEALIIAFMGALRWREQENVLRSVTGARKDSIGGAVWMG
jgi:anhydro-N-acetylmuramic acid kinase